MGRGSGTGCSPMAEFCRLALLPSVDPARTASPALGRPRQAPAGAPEEHVGMRERDRDGPPSL
jgi:hypothetical protein